MWDFDEDGNLFFVDELGSIYSPQELGINFNQESGSETFDPEGASGVSSLNKMMEELKARVPDPSALNADELDRQLGEAYRAAGITVPDAQKTGFFDTVKKALQTPAGLLTAGRAIYGLLGGGDKPKAAGYEGKIPTLTSVRQQIKQPEYQPYTGQATMGRRFFTDQQYVAPNAVDAAKTAATTQAAELEKAIPTAPPAATAPNANVVPPATKQVTASSILNDFLAKQSPSGQYERMDFTGLPAVIPEMAKKRMIEALGEKFVTAQEAAQNAVRPGSPPARGGLAEVMPIKKPEFTGTPAPSNVVDVSQSQDFYTSPEYQKYLSEQEGAINTMDMYDSPYFGMRSSGSAGRAQDRAYENFLARTGTKNSTGSSVTEKPELTGLPAPIMSPMPIVGPSKPSYGNTPEDFGYTDEQFDNMLLRQSVLPPPNRPVASNVQMAAHGGIMQAAQGRYLRGKTDGMADKIPSSIDGVQPAALSHGEFVIPADVVSHLGNGNSDAGANQLYKMMDRVRKDRTGTVKQGKEINPDKYLSGGIASYATGGVAKFQTGGSSSAALAPSSSNPYGSTATTTLAPYIGDYATNMLGRAQALAQSPYEAYQGPLTAGYSPLQQQAFTAAGNINPQATFDTQSLQNYMNPYTQLSLQPQLDELRRQADISQQNIQGQFSRAGAFGGAREAIARAENARNLQTAQSGLIGKGFENAFNQAMGQYNIGRQQQLSDLGALAGLGAQQRGIEQEGITALQKQFEQEKMDPYTKLQFQQSMMQGLPVGTTSITPNLSDLQKTGITLKQAQDMYEIFKNIPGFSEAITK